MTVQFKDDYCFCVRTPNIQNVFTYEYTFKCISNRFDSLIKTCDFRYFLNYTQKYERDKSTDPPHGTWTNHEVVRLLLKCNIETPCSFHLRTIIYIVRFYSNMAVYVYYGGCRFDVARAYF